MVRSFAAWSAVLFLAAGGCSKIKYEQSSELELGRLQTYTVASPSANHKVRIEITSDTPVNAYVVMARDIEGKDPDSLTTKPASALAGESKTKSATLDVVIPTKEDFVLCVVPVERKAKVSVKMDSQ